MSHLAAAEGPWVSSCLLLGFYVHMSGGVTIHMQLAMYYPLDTTYICHIMAPP